MRLFNSLKETFNLIFGKNILSGKSILSASFLSYINLFLSTIVAILIVPILLDGLGITHYGIYVLLISTVGYFSLFNLGLTDALIRYVSEFHAVNNINKIKTITSSSTYFFLFIGFVVFILSLIFLNFLSSIFKIDIENISIFKTGFLLLAFNFVISLQGGVLSSVISGYQKNDIVKFFNLIQIIVYNSLIYIFIKLGYGLLGVIFSAIISSVFLIFLCSIYILKNKVAYSFNPRFFDKKILIKIFPYSFKIFTMSITSQILYRSDAIIIGIYLSSIYLTNYDVMYKISFLVAMLSTAFSEVLFPTYSRLNSLKDISQIKKLLKLNIVISISVVSFFTMFLTVWGNNIFDIWLGNKVEISINVFFFMLLINFLHAIGPCFTVLKAIGKIKLLTISSIVNAVLNVVLSIILIKEYGLVGVLYATLIAHISTDTLVTFYSLKRYLKLDLINFFKKTIIPPILFSLALFPICILIFNSANNIGINIYIIVLSLFLLFLIYSTMIIKYTKKYIIFKN